MIGKLLMGLLLRPKKRKPNFSDLCLENYVDLHKRWTLTREQRDALLVENAQLRADIHAVAEAVGVMFEDDGKQHAPPVDVLVRHIRNFRSRAAGAAPRGDEQKTESPR